MSIAYLNGNFVALQDAKVSILDRGFLFADGVYEVIPAYAGQYFRFDEHLERLNRSLAAIKMELVLNIDEWRQIAEQLLEKNQQLNASLYLQVTRGTYSSRSHELPTQLQPTIMAMISPLPQVAQNLDSKVAGISAITAQDIRWQRCDIKSVGLLANCLLLQQALESGADDTILVRDGMAIEATASNLFIFKDQKVITPPLNQQILPGVTRDFIIMLVKKLGFRLEQRAIPETELLQADEIWLTSSTKEIRPVVRLNDAKIADGKVGAIWHQINELYQQLKKALYQGQLTNIGDISDESKL